MGTLTGGVPRSPIPITLLIISDILIKARSEEWQELALLTHEGERQWLLRAGWDSARMFIVLGQKLDREVVLRCTGVQRLAIYGDLLGPADAHALATLTGLTSLDLSQPSNWPRGWVLAS